MINKKKLAIMIWTLSWSLYTIVHYRHYSVQCALHSTFKNEVLTSKDLYSVDTVNYLRTPHHGTSVYKSYPCAVHLYINIYIWYGKATLNIIQNTSHNKLIKITKGERSSLNVKWNLDQNLDKCNVQNTLKKLGLSTLYNLRRFFTFCWFQVNILYFYNYTIFPFKKYV